MAVVAFLPPPSSESVLPASPTGRRWPSGLDAVALLAGLAGVAGVLAEGRPSGVVVADATWRFAFACGLCVLTARSRPWTWFMLAAVAATGLAPPASPAWSAGALSLLVAAAAVAGTAARRGGPERRWRMAHPSDKRTPSDNRTPSGNRTTSIWGAAVGALGAQALLRLPTAWPTRSSAALAGGVLVLVAASVYRGLSRRRRRRARRIALLAGVVVLGMGWLSALAVLEARPGADLGAEQARAAVDAARNGDMVRSAALFDAAARAFRGARAPMGAWYVRPSFALPVLGQHGRALEVATMEGARVSTVAAATAREADVSRLELTNGSIDLARVEAMVAPLARAASALATARSHVEGLGSPWLVTPLASRLEHLTTQVSDAAEAADLAATTVAQLPGLLGGDGPRHYFVGFTTPAESRHLGGLLADFAEITAEGGRLHLSRSGSVAQLNDLAAPDKLLSGPPGYLARYAGLRPGRHFQNVTASPHFPDVGRVVTELYPQAPGGRDLDGVIFVDPEALVAVLALTGPVDVPGLGEPLTAANAADLLLRGQYFRFDRGGPGGGPQGTVDQGERYEFLAGATTAIFEALLTRTTLPGPAQLAQLFGPPARRARLFAFSPDAAEEGLFGRLGLAGAFPAPEGGDVVGLFQANAGQNKLDAYLRRELDYSATFDPATGQASAVATARLTSAVPSGVLPYEVGYNLAGLPPGTNQTQLSLYSALELGAVTMDGSPVPVSVSEELGVHVYTVPLELGRDRTVTVVFELAGRLRAGSYRLALAHQPLPYDDVVKLSVRAASLAWQPGRDHELTVREGVAQLDLGLSGVKRVDVPFTRR